jgi:type I restriction enzyme S subunit
VPALAQATTNFRLIEFPLPKLESQQKIANVLSSLDAKIELNNRINTELEAMAKTLYDYWFVQFNFPFDFAQGKQNTEGKPYKSSGGKMVWNEELKREIPEGWEVKMINSIIDVKDGTHDSPKPKNEGFRLITSKNLLVSGLDFENANLISEEDYLSIIKRSNVETGDILFSMIGNIGTVYKIEEKKINFAIKNVALYKTSQKNEYKNYIYMFLKSIDMERYMKNVISGSIQKFIGLNSLRNTPILSNDNYILKFNESTQSIFEKLETIKLENQHLTSLRDWLLPMLMNGQISVGVDGEMSNDVMMAAEDGVGYGK